MGVWADTPPSASLSPRAGVSEVNLVCSNVLSCFSRYPTLCDPMDSIGWDSSESMGFFRQEYWSGLPCPPPGNLPHPGIEPASLMSPALAGRFFTNSTTWPRLILKGPMEQELVLGGHWIWYTMKSRPEAGACLGLRSPQCTRFILWVNLRAFAQKGGK